MKRIMKLPLVVFCILFVGSPAFAQDRAVSFKNDVMPVFFKAGCNAGDCHGASRGQDGFRLSLFGYDADGDYYRLVEEHPGRRINRAAPGNSLLLKKATGNVSHTGGELFTSDSESFDILLRWLKQGAQRDADDSVKPLGIRFQNERYRFSAPGKSLQTKVIATYSNGSQRDVTRWSIFSTSNESVAQINDAGFLTAPKSGGAHIFARFDAFTVAMEVIVLPQGRFSWSNPPENNYIDNLSFARLKDMRIQPSQLCSDEQFLRRATIDLNGMLPTPDEYRAFMKSTDPAKRSRLIDTLMNRDAFPEMLAARWGEWLRIYTDTNPGSGTAPIAGWNYYEWILEQIRENTPLDKFAYKLVTGNGSNLTSPPSNYYTMLPQGKLDPSRLSEDTAQIFLGIRTQCAQCHNHPFDRWTIDDYYAFQSFFTGVRRKHGSEAREYFTYVDVDAEPALHPVDQRPMKHRFLGGAFANVKDKDPRKVLARWMTSADNRLFREHMANRIWFHFFGKGIVEPVDDVRISNPPSNAPLIAELGRRLAEDYDYDQRKLIRDICNSRTYQLSATVNKSNQRDTRLFSHADLRRMRADVFFDCLSQALDYKHKFRRSSATRAVAMFEGGRRDSFNSYFFSTFGQARRESVCLCEDVTGASLSQALHLINGRTIDQALQRNPTLIPALMNQFDQPQPIVESLYIRTLCRRPSEKELAGILETLSNVTDRREQQRKYNNVLWALLNSSEFLFNH